jgi:succinoglycan biosynthesis transport protein ExoP
MSSEPRYPLQRPEPRLHHVVPGPPMGGSPNEHGVPNDSMLRPLLEGLAMVRRRFWLVLFFVLASVAGGVWKVRHDVPLYRTSGSIRILDKRRAISGNLATPVAEAYGQWADRLLSEVEVLRSARTAAEVVRRLGLQVVPQSHLLSRAYLDSVSVTSPAASSPIELSFSETTVRASGFGAVASAAYGQPVELPGARFIITRRPPLPETSLQVISFDDATGTLAATIRAGVREGTDLVDVTYSGTDPVLAAHIVNTTVVVFQEASATNAKQESVRTRKFLADQLASEQAAMDVALTAYDAFRSKQKVFSSQEKFRAQQASLTDLEIRRKDLDANRIVLRSLLDSVARQPRAGESRRLVSLVSSPVVANNPIIAPMFALLGRQQDTRDSLINVANRPATYPDVVNVTTQIARTEANVLEAVREQLRVTDTQIATLDESMRALGNSLSDLPSTESAEGTLLAKVEAHKREVEKLRDAVQSAQINEAAEAGQVEIVDPARAPTGALAGRRKLQLVFSLLMGLLIGTAAAYFMENRKAVIRRREDLDRVGSLPLLAMIPKFAAQSSMRSRLLPRSTPRSELPTHGSGVDLVFVNDPQSAMAESFRTLRTNLLFSAANNQLRRVVVSSAGPSEGKTTTAANLAIAFALQGHRVLVMDCDLRKPRLHKVFTHSQSPGVTESLVLGASLDDTCRETAIDGLHVMTCGYVPPNPAELLGSPAMERMLDDVSTRYDIVVIDTPPLLAASDASIMSRISDGAVLVVRAGRTEIQAVRAATEQMQKVGAPILGLVLNDPDAEVAKYAHYYGYYYNNYYRYESGPTA